MCVGFVSADNVRELIVLEEIINCCRAETSKVNSRAQRENYINESKENRKRDSGSMEERFLTRKTNVLPHKNNS